MKATLERSLSSSKDQKEPSHESDMDEGGRANKRPKVSAAIGDAGLLDTSVTEDFRKAKDLADVRDESGNLKETAILSTEPSRNLAAEASRLGAATEQLGGGAGVGQSTRRFATEQSSEFEGVKQPNINLTTDHPGNGTQHVRETDSASDHSEQGHSQAQPSGNTKEQPASIGKAALPKKTVVTKLTANVAEDRGTRHTMEDAWQILPQGWLGEAGELRLAHFAIYDGHGGRHAAEYARAHLHANVLSAGFPRESVDVRNAKRAIAEGFKNTDEALLRESTADGWLDGATVVSVWVLGQTVFIANLGDAKAVLARASPNDQGESLSGNSLPSVKSKQESLKGLIVTKEHKAIFPSERARIEKAGAYIEGNGRLLGRLEVSRAFGDRNFKKAGVIAVPDVQKFELTERERFLILGCDGLWGVFGPDDAVEFVAEQLKNNVPLDMVCRRLIREAVRERKCTDNCTAIIIDFEHSHQ